MDNESDIDLLLTLLADTTEEQPQESVPIAKRTLEDISVFDQENIDSGHCSKDDNLRNHASNSYNADLDSSDDEDARNNDTKYNNYGKEIKSLMQHANSHSNNNSFNTFKQVDKFRQPSWKTTPKISQASDLKPQQSGSLDSKSTVKACYDPIFGLRISNPLVSSAVLKERMVSREAIPFNSLEKFLQKDSNKDINWVIGGVIVSKSEVKVSQKGSQYSVWTLSDLKNQLKTVSLFLFKNAHKSLWKTTIQGTVVAVLNPSVLERRKDSKDEASLSVDNPDRIMILGQSKDLGFCKSRKKNGDPCNAFVNISTCEFCIYHVKQEYNRFSKRPDIQGPTGARGLTALRNKVLGKNEVFYAGKSYTAIPATKSRKLVQKDENILRMLSGNPKLSRSKILNSAPSPKQNKLNAARVECSNRQRVKDLERLKLLGAPIDTLNFLTETTEFNTKPSTQISSDKEINDKTNEKLIDGNKYRIENKRELPKMQLDKSLYKSSPVILEECSLNLDNKIDCNLTEADKNLTKSKSLTKTNFNKCELSVQLDKSLYENFPVIIEEYSLNLSEKKDKNCNLEARNLTKSKINSNLNRSFKNRLANSADTLKKEDNKYMSPSEFKATLKAGLNDTKPILSQNSIGLVNLTEKNESRSYANNNLTRDNLNNKKKKSIDMETQLNLSSTSKVLTTDKQTKLVSRINAYKQNINQENSSSSTQKYIAPSEFMNNLKTNIEKNESDSRLIQPILNKPSIGLIDLSAPSKTALSNRVMNKSRLKALKYISENGPIKKLDPMTTKGSKSTKRILEQIENASPEYKRIKIEETKQKQEKYKEIMEAKSINEHLITTCDMEAEEEYFDKLAKKERMEEKMMTTFKVACKAVKCLQCKYTSFSASELCKAEGHTLKVLDAWKRFFKCGDCSNRTVTLDLIPLKECKKCGNTKWLKTAMMKEKIAQVGETLSIRGGEEKFIGTMVVNNDNINLLVPE